MAKITFKGQPANTCGELASFGAKAPNFKLTAADLSDKTLDDYRGKKVLLNIFPSIDTGVCAASARKFNELASQMENTVVLCVSADLPFALNRFCAAEGIQNVEVLSSFRSTFGDDYGLKLVDTPLRNLLSRVVIVLNENGTVRYTEQVPELTQEPNYQAALDALK